jgi:hypothetical protein
MWIPGTVLGLVLLLAAVSAIGKAQKGQWYAAGGLLLPVLGVSLMALSGAEHLVVLFVLGLALTLIGFLLEFSAYRRRSAEGKASADASP